MVVHVDREEQSRRYTGSRIYRHVRLQATNKVHVKEHGIFVSTQNDGTVKVTEIIGDSNCKISYTILDRLGKKVATATTKSDNGIAPLKSNDIGAAATTLQVKNPQL